MAKKFANNVPFQSKIREIEFVKRMSNVSKIKCGCVLVCGLSKKLLTFSQFPNSFFGRKL